MRGVRHSAQGAVRPHVRGARSHRQVLQRRAVHARGPLLQLRGRRDDDHAGPARRTADYMAAMGPQSLAKAGERGYNLASVLHTPLVHVYADAQTEAGRTRDDYRLMSGPVTVHIAPTRDQAWDEAERALHWWVTFYRNRGFDMPLPPVKKMRTAGRRHLRSAVRGRDARRLGAGGARAPQGGRPRRDGDPVQPSGDGRGRRGAVDADVRRRADARGEALGSGRR